MLMCLVIMKFRYINTLPPSDFYKLGIEESTLESTSEKEAELTTLSTQQAEDISVYESKQRSYETERRQLHNTIQELKGNIRVFCRIRPLLGAEIEKHGGQFNHIVVQVN